jgi:hypothetical protein
MEGTSKDTKDSLAKCTVTIRNPIKDAVSQQLASLSRTPSALAAQQVLFAFSAQPFVPFSVLSALQ